MSLANAAILLISKYIIPSNAPTHFRILSNAPRPLMLLPTPIHTYINHTVIHVGDLHNPSSLALFPIFLKANGATYHLTTSVFPSIFIHLRVPLFLLSCYKCLEFVLLTSSQVQRCRFSLGNGFGDKDVFDA